MSDGTMFAGDHPQSGDWATLKGRALSPYVLDVLTSTAMGDTRHQTNNMPSQMWDATTVVNTPLTHGGGTMAK